MTQLKTSWRGKKGPDPTRWPLVDVIGLAGCHHSRKLQPLASNVEKTVEAIDQQPCTASFAAIDIIETVER